MFTFIVFTVSLVLLILLFVMKNMEINRGRKIFLEKQFENFDNWIYKILLRVKFWWSHFNFKNIKRVFSWVVINTRESAVTVKRRFDHKQSHFFTKRDHDISKNKASTSFFLKDVADYKKNLREGKENKN